MRMPAPERDRWCTRIGLYATSAFIVAATILALRNASGPDGGAPPPLFMRVLNQRKYPASVLFLLMTLGPTVAMLPTFERMRGRAADVLQTFGRVPLFYYLLHIPLIHLLAIGVSYIRSGSANPWLFGNHPMMPGPVPEGYRWSLPLLYLVFAIAVTLLYFPCRWYARQKAHNPKKWMGYL
jgi:hypothetical protein